MNITIGGIQRDVSDEQLEKIHKLLETELRTPDNIAFQGAVGPGHITGIFFNGEDQILYRHGNNYVVWLAGSSAKRTNRKLVPIERKDLRPGDVVYRDENKRNPGEYSDMYGVVLDEERVTYIKRDKEVWIDGMDYTYWWKVV